MRRSEITLIPKDSLETRNEEYALAIPPNLSLPLDLDPDACDIAYSLVTLRHKLFAFWYVHTSFCGDLV